jgi:Transposase, Mutator family
MRYVAYRDRKQVARDLKPIYRAVNEDAALEALEAFDRVWGERYPMIADSWRARWEYITPFIAQPADLRRAVYTTNSIENLTRQIRMSLKTRGHFTDEQAATKLIYLAIQRAETKWRTAYNWTNALRAPQDPLRRPKSPTKYNPTAEPHRRRVDQLLRPVLPDRARSPPQARQRLPEALGRQEIQAAVDWQALPRVWTGLRTRQPGLFIHWRTVRTYQR